MNAPFVNQPGSVASPLAARIGAAIDAAGGWMPFERFMDLALYEPGFGYYASGGHRGTCHAYPYCHNLPGTLGVAAGYVAAAVIDYALLSPDRPRKPPARWWAPTAAAAPGGASIGVVGGF